MNALIRRAALISGALVLCVSGGCAPYRSSMDRVLDRLARGDPGAALAQLEKKPRDQDALYQFERGLLLRLVGRRDESSASFDLAHGIAEDLYTRSVGRETAALAVTDRVRPYRPPTHELLLARQYQARNYLENGDLEGAAVEARRIVLLCEDVAAGALDPPAGGDLLARLTAGLVFEAAGDRNNALVVYRNLLREANASDETLAFPLPPWLLPRAMRLAGDFGVDLTGEVPPESIAAGPTGEPAFTAVVFVEGGFVPPLREATISVPILKDEEGEDRGWVGGVVGSRALKLSHNEWSSPGPDAIAYWLEVALPEYGPDPYAPFACEVVAAGREDSGSPVADVGASARAALDADLPGIALRAALRALIKYSAHHQAEETGGAVFGILVNLIGVATESAETRSWLSLPDHVTLAVIDASAPVERVTLRIRENDGNVDVIDLPLARAPGSAFGFGTYRAWK